MLRRSSHAEKKHGTEGMNISESVSTFLILLTRT